MIMQQRPEDYANALCLPIGGTAVNRTTKAYEIIASVCRLMVKSRQRVFFTECRLSAV